MIDAVIWDLGDTLVNPPTGGQDFKPLDQYDEIRLRPGATDALQVLADLGVSQAILSNTGASDSDVVTRTLQRLGIAHYFSFIYATESELTHDKPEKPDPAAFQIVLDALGVKPHNAVMIGNHWDKDIVGANRSGIHAIWLTNPAVSVRLQQASAVQSPPWILPVWDVDAIPQAFSLLRSYRA